MLKELKSYFGWALQETYIFTRYLYTELIANFGHI